MTTELMKEFIGKVCSITLFGEMTTIKGKITLVENDWIKLEEASDAIFSEKGKSKNTTTRILNCNMICQVKILPEKYQK